MSSEAPRICVVGSTNIDLTFRTPRLPRPGETVAGHGFSVGFGGKGANQAVMAARLGAQAAMVARVGADSFGAQMIANLRSENIDTTHVREEASCPSGTAAIIVDDEAANCIICVPGANAALTPAHVREAASTIRLADVVVCQIEVPLEASLEAFRLAKAAGVRTILNPAPACRLPPELIALTDVLVPNETEVAVMLADGDNLARHPEGARRAAARIGIARLIVTLGSDGALVVDEAIAEHIPARKVTAVDPTGAGDAFIGSLAVYWAQGCSLCEAAERAGAVAALAVTRLGAQAAFPTAAEVEAFLDVPSRGMDKPAKRVADSSPG